MKFKNYNLKAGMILSLFVLSVTVRSQTVSTFENLILAPDSHYDGSSGAGAFTSGNASFQNSYNAAWTYWESGFAYSNEGDTVLSPSDYMTQIFQTKAGTGHLSSNFAIGQQGAKVNLTGLAESVQFVYVANTTYAYNSMALGDAFGKKFGDTLNSPHSADSIHGSYPDWFKLSITGYRSGSVITDTVHFYLADYRFSNDSLDYILKGWQMVDLTSLGNVDSLEFWLSSSDVGTWGMNTPAYFCIDNLGTQDMVVGIGASVKQTYVKAYPNPFTDHFNLSFENEGIRNVFVYNALGELVYTTETSEATLELDFNLFNSGIYFVKVSDAKQVSTIRLIKK